MKMQSRRNYIGKKGKLKSGIRTGQGGKGGAAGSSTQHAARRPQTPADQRAFWPAGSSTCSNFRLSIRNSRCSRSSADELLVCSMSLGISFKQQALQGQVCWSSCHKSRAHARGQSLAQGVLGGHRSGGLIAAAPKSFLRAAQEGERSKKGGPPG